MNLLLIPEVPFSITNICELVKNRVTNRGHCLIAIAEGAGQDILQRATPQFDASGNRVLVDVGIWLRDEIAKYLKMNHIEFTIKYIDPSYTIRSAPANTVDSVFCVQVAQMAVHAAMRGKTNCTVGVVNGHFIVIPLERTTSERKQVDSSSVSYQVMLDNTGMPIKLT